MRTLTLLFAFLAALAAPAAAKPSFSIADAKCQLGQHCVFTITKTGAATSYSDIAFASTGAAGESIKVTKRFLRADTVKTVAVGSLAPGQFTATIKIARYGVIGRGTAIGTVLAPTPLPAISIQSVGVDENAGSVVVHALRSGSLAGSSSIGYSTADVTAIAGINYTARSGTLTFAPGVSDISFAVPVLDDAKVQGDLKFNVLLSAPLGATIGQNGSVTIRNIDVAPPATQTCPDGSVIPATSVCPVAPPPAPTPAPGMAIAAQACSSLNGNGAALIVGQSYSIVGYAGLVQPTDPPPPAGTKEIIILNDATHRGDGWFGLYVPIGCVTAG